MNKALVFALAAAAGWFFILRPKAALAGGAPGGGAPGVMPPPSLRGAEVAAAPFHTQTMLRDWLTEIQASGMTIQNGQVVPAGDAYLMEASVAPDDYF